MNTLHIVRQSVFVSNDFEQCINVLRHQDTVILMDDGCYNLNHPLLCSVLNKLETDIDVSFIDTHAKARAVKNTNPVIQSINITELVKLTFNHQKVITWQ